MLSCEIVRILTFRKKDHLHVQALLQHKPYTPQSRLDAGVVTVIDDRYIIGELAYQPDLLYSQRCSAGCHDIRDAELMHRQHIQISLHQYALVLTGHLVLGEPDAVKRTALDIYLRFRRVHIFGDRFVSLQRTAAECYNPAACRMDREHDPVEETVDKTAVVIFYAESCLDKKLLLVSCGTGSIRKCLTAYRSPSETVLTDRLVFKASALEILISYGLTFRSLQAFLKELSGKFGNQEKALVTLALCDLLCRLLLFNHLDMVFPCQIFQSFCVRHILMFHHKAYGSTGLAAAEALVYSL